VTHDVNARSRIADAALAHVGDERIAWVERHSPVLNALARERLSDGALTGRRVAVVVHLEAKTAYLALLLAEAGAHVVAAGSNPRSTNDAVCAALVRRGVEVHAVHGAGPGEFDADLLAVADTAPEIVVDDGAELTTRMAQHRGDLLGGLRGVTEETTTGVARLRAMDAAGRLTFPAVAANDAACKHLFDNRYGTGQTTVQAVLALTNSTLWGTAVTVVGYGWVGRGVAQYARGLGARVTVVEVDPVKALEAHMEGYRVGSLSEVLPDSRVVVTATGGVDAIPADAVPLLRDGVILANAGHDDREIDVGTLREAAESVDEPRAGVERLRLPGDREVHLLVGAGLVNIAGGDGHPIEIMDLSFAVQALSAHYIASTSLAPGIHRFPDDLDRAIARTKLATLGITLDESASALDAIRGEWASGEHT